MRIPVRSLGAVSPLVFVLHAACAGEDGGNPAEGSRWEQPSACEDLYQMEFEATGGDPYGTWIPVKLCSFQRGTTYHMLQTCGLEGETDFFMDTSWDLESFAVNEDGTCETVGSGKTEILESWLPLDGCSPGSGDLADWCRFNGHEEEAYPDLDLVLGEETCSIEPDGEFCVCTRQNVYGSRWTGRFPCAVSGTTMMWGPPGFEEVLAFSVEGDYLIRKVIAHPTHLPPRADGEPAAIHYGFEIYRRAPAQ